MQVILTQPTVSAATGKWPKVWSGKPWMKAKSAPARHATATSSQILSSLVAVYLALASLTLASLPSLQSKTSQNEWDTQPEN